MKQQINEVRRMQQLAGVLENQDAIPGKITLNVPEDTDVEDFAKAVTYELINNYGAHNYEAFLRTLNTELKTHRKIKDA